MLKMLQMSEDFKVEEYLAKIPEYINPEKAADNKLTVVYEFHDSGENDGAWTVTISDGKCYLKKGEPEEYDTLMYMTAEVYHRILTGRLDHNWLTYSSGAVRYFGNTLGHRELNSYLSIPKGIGITAL